jgi:hypothetical protein
MMAGWLITSDYTSVAQPSITQASKAASFLMAGRFIYVASA